MSYQDEELLRLRQKAEEFNKQRVSEDTLAEELKESIHDPVTHITKIPVVFEERDLLDGRIVMRVPRDLGQLTDDAVRQQFLMESKPQFVYELPYLPFGLTFMLTEIQGDEARIEQMFPYMVNTVKTVGPNIRILSTGKKVIHGIYVRWFDAIAQAITEPSYRKVFVFALDGKTTIGCITCPSRLKKRYQPIMEEMMETLNIPKKAAEEGIDDE